MARKREFEAVDFEMTQRLHSPPPRRPSGCWHIAFASALIAVALTIIALFLPPFDLAERLLSLSYTPLSAGAPAQTFHDELRLSLASDAAPEEIALKVTRLTEPELANGDSHEHVWLPNALAALPPDLTLRSPLYVLETRGDETDGLRINLEIPPAISDLDPISLRGWDGDEWRFMPALRVESQMQASARFLLRAIAIFEYGARPPIIQVSQDVIYDLDPEIAELATILSPAGLRPTGHGGLIGSLAPGGSSDADYLFMPLLRNFSHPHALDRQTVEGIISSPALRRKHVEQITNLARFNRFDGVFIDYRGFSAAYRDHFARFITDLAASLAAQDLHLGLVVPAERDESGGWKSAAYDWPSIGAAADYFQVLAPLHPLDFAPASSASLDNLLRQVTNAVDRRKVLLTLSVRSLRELDGVSAPIGWHEAFAALGDVVLDAETVSDTGTIEPGTVIRASLSGYRARVGIDSDLRLLYLDYLDDRDTAVSRIWLADAAALSNRLERIRDFAIAGIALDDLLASDRFAGLTTVIERYRSQLPANPPPNQLGARWSIDSVDGSLDQVDSRLGTDLVLTLEAPDGHYAVNWSVIAADDVQSARKGAVLPLFEPTLTPTPTPTPTPVPRPVAAPISAPASNFGSAPPAAGSIRIAIGGHVTETNSPRAIGPMRSAGMTWMKKQVRFDWHGPQDAGPIISAAHNNGFKVLIGTVGHPHELASGGESYIDSYTSWLQRIAGQGADAIEVWNEPNLDREWPRGQISGIAYARMLAIAYTKIKQVNPNTMVISAAPAPTGVADIPDRVMPDNRWLRQMVEGGGLNYLDCVGAHYNEGIVPPSQTSGDPRGDNYYTRYFYGMLNGYISITRKPICFTELGYLTSEGLPNLPSYFSWAQNVTLQQQATWLAQAAALASRSGQVPLLIVWNIDFTHYQADPQAGYAIVRPDGSCPACSALAAAR